MLFLEEADQPFQGLRANILLHQLRTPLNSAYFGEHNLIPIAGIWGNFDSPETALGTFKKLQRIDM
jgi:hypothetical protein